MDEILTLNCSIKLHPSNSIDLLIKIHFQIQVLCRINIRFRITRNWWIITWDALWGLRKTMSSQLWELCGNSMRTLWTLLRKQSDMVKTLPCHIIIFNKYLIFFKFQISKNNYSTILLFFIIQTNNGWFTALGMDLKQASNALKFHLMQLSFKSIFLWVQFILLYLI